MDQWQVTAREVLTYSPPHLCYQCGAHSHPCSLDLSPLTGGNTSRVNNVFSKVVPNHNVGEEAARQTGRGVKQKLYNHIRRFVSSGMAFAASICQLALSTKYSRGILSWKSQRTSKDVEIFHTVNQNVNLVVALEEKSGDQ